MKINKDKLKKAIVSLALMGGCVLGSGLAINTYANTLGAPAPQRAWQRDRWEREREREELDRIRRLDRERRLRYRMSGFNRQVGYYDRFGQFHAYGFYDRFGRFRRY